MTTSGNFVLKNDFTSYLYMTLDSMNYIVFELLVFVLMHNYVYVAYGVFF